MQMLTFSAESKGAEVFTAEIPAELRDEAELWRAQMLDQLSMYSDELTELLLAEEPVPAALIHKVLREATIHNLAVPRALRLGLGRDRRAAGAGRRGPLSAQPGRRAAGRRRRSEEARRQARSQARPRRAVLRPGVQDSGRPARRPALRPHLFRRVEGQQPRLQPGQGQEGERAATVAHPGRPPQPGRIGLGRRHHRHRRPAALDHRRHALQHAGADPAWSRSPFRKR